MASPTDADIYSNAVLVVSWLGPTASDSNLAKQKLSKVITKTHNLRESNPSMSELKLWEAHCTRPSRTFQK